MRDNCYRIVKTLWNDRTGRSSLSFVGASVKIARWQSRRRRRRCVRRRGCTLERCKISGCLARFWKREVPARYRCSPHVVSAERVMSAVSPGWRAAGGGLASSKGQHYCTRECTLVAWLVYNAWCIPATTDTRRFPSVRSPRADKKISTFREYLRRVGERGSKRWRKSYFLCDLTVVREVRLIERSIHSYLFELVVRVISNKNSITKVIFLSDWDISDIWTVTTGYVISLIYCSFVGVFKYNISLHITWYLHNAILV